MHKNIPTLVSRLRGIGSACSKKIYHNYTRAPVDSRDHSLL